MNQLTKYQDEKRQDSENSPRLLRRTRYVRHAALAEREVPVRGRLLLRRRWSGCGDGWPRGKGEGDGGVKTLHRRFARRVCARLRLDLSKSEQTRRANLR